MQIEKHNRKSDSQHLLATTGQPILKQEMANLLGRYRHCQSPCFLVGGKTDNVETASNDTIDQQCNRLSSRHLRGTICPDPVELASEVAVYHTLDKGERRHPHEQIKGVEFESVTAAGLNQIGDDSLESGEKSAE